MIWVYFEFEFVSKKHFKNLISSLIGANSHFFLGPQKGMYSFSTKISSLVDLSIFSLLPLAYKHLSITRNLWKRCSDLNRTVHLLNVSFSLCESALLRYFELLVHPQPTTLSISTIVRPIGWNVLILSVSVQSNVLRRFRLFEYLFDLDIGLLEHWLFGRWLRLTINIWSKKNIKCNKIYHMFPQNKYLHKGSIGEKMFFWYGDHLAVFEALISWACFGELYYKYKHERNYIFHNFFSRL